MSKCDDTTLCPCDQICTNGTCVTPPLPEKCEFYTRTIRGGQIPQCGVIMGISDMGETSRITSTPWTLECGGQAMIKYNGIPSQMTGHFPLNPDQFHHCELKTPDSQAFPSDKTFQITYARLPIKKQDLADKVDTGLPIVELPWAYLGCK